MIPLHMFPISVHFVPNTHRFVIYSTWPWNPG